MNARNVIIAIGLAASFSFYMGCVAGKHAADLWWQADEAKKIQTVWGIAGQSIWDNAAQCSTGCSAIVADQSPLQGMDGTFCGDNSGCYTMKDGLCVSGDCFGKPIDDTDKFACPGKGPANAQELAWWRAHATPEHPCPKEQPKP